MIDDLALELHPIICTAISSLLDDDILEVVSSRPAGEIRTFRREAGAPRADTSILDAAMAAIALRSVVDDEFDAGQRHSSIRGEPPRIGRRISENADRAWAMAKDSPPLHFSN